MRAPQAWALARPDASAALTCIIDTGVMVSPPVGSSLLPLPGCGALAFFLEAHGPPSAGLAPNLPLRISLLWVA